MHPVDLYRENDDPTGLCWEAAPPSVVQQTQDIEPPHKMRSFCLRPWRTGVPTLEKLALCSPFVGLERRHTVRTSLSEIRGF